MKRLIAMTLIVTSLIACKKDKAEPVPTSVEYSPIGIQYKKELGIYTQNWLSMDDLTAKMMPQISIDAALQKTILFGFYKNGPDYGLYSPEVFPVEYGQENWLHHQSVIFKKSTLTLDELGSILQKNNQKLPAGELIGAWHKGVNPKSVLTHPHEGEIWLFRTTDNKVTGLFQVSSIDAEQTTMMAEMFIAK
ncbi:MAG: hypothetical protein ACTHMC_14490 [Pseudobacter sp.]|uniref:hypothetical protein n=1 Tax=Pseudobacter sp. TaxID=2045420 RepID=UPI003F814EF0